MIDINKFDYEKHVNNSIVRFGFIFFLIGMILSYIFWIRGILIVIAIFVAIIYRSVNVSKLIEDSSK
jgi:uncharacterized membrane protein